MEDRWEGVEALFVRCAEDDLEGSGEVRPGMAAFAGRGLRFLAWVRPFAKGAYHKPLIELFALAAPLDADRIALCMPGRAWSLQDPIPPVSREADMRQRVLILHRADGTRGRVRSVSVLHPFDRTDDGVRWGEPRHLPGGQGWIFQATELAIRQRRRLRADDAQIRAQALRVSRLGHDLYLAPDLCERLGLRPQRA